MVLLPTIPDRVPDEQHCTIPATAKPTGISASTRRRVCKNAEVGH